MKRNYGFRFHKLVSIAIIGSSAVAYSFPAKAQQYQSAQPQAIQQPSGQNPNLNRSDFAQAPSGQPVSQQAPVGQAVVQPLNSQQAPVPPFPPLPADHERYLNDVLQKWTAETDKIERYRCDFQRWTFDGKPVHSQYAKGVVRYLKPDQGLFKVDELFFNQGSDANGAPQFRQVEGMFGEWWICDGKTLHEFDRNQQQVTRYALPPDMQGVAIINSPLPFLFGVKSDAAKARYWLRPLAPPNDAEGKPREDILVIEAFPKYLADAQNYSRVRVFLDKRQFLPTQLEIFLPNWTPANDSREVFEFANREVNWSFIDRIQDALTFKNQFIQVEPPKGWKIIDAQQPPVPGADNRQAELPQGIDTQR